MIEFKPITDISRLRFLTFLTSIRSTQKGVSNPSTITDLKIIEIDKRDRRQGSTKQDFHVKNKYCSKRYRWKLNGEQNFPDRFTQRQSLDGTISTSSPRVVTNT